ncbi:MAG: hypothetical protein Q4B80_06065 [Aerococcaceae bacterium]|nr:hypothetical protein [Aerococcaceae bacterium]
MMQTSFMQLLFHEMNRAKKFYLILCAGVLLSQLFHISTEVYHFIEYGRVAGGEGITYISLSMLLHRNGGYHLIVVITAMLLLGYAILMWAREWLFQGKFIYRLMMLPTNRLAIAYAKIVAVLLMIFGILSLQAVILWGINAILPQILPHWVRYEEGVPALYPILPLKLSEFVMIYTVGTGFLVGIFNVVIFLCSSRAMGWLRRIAVLVLYGLLSYNVLLMFSVISGQLVLTSQEHFIYIGLCAVIWLVGHLAVMHYFIKRRLSI